MGAGASSASIAEPQLTDLTQQEFDDLVVRVSKVIQSNPSKADDLYKKAALLANEGRTASGDQGDSGGVPSSESEPANTHAVQTNDKAKQTVEAELSGLPTTSQLRPAVDVAFAEAVAAALSRARQDPPKFAMEVLEPILGEFVTKGGNPVRL